MKNVEKLNYNNGKPIQSYNRGDHMLIQFLIRIIFQHRNIFGDEVPVIIGVGVDQIKPKAGRLCGFGIPRGCRRKE